MKREEAINVSEWGKRRHKTLRHKLERRKGDILCVHSSPLFKELLSKKAPVSVAPK